MFSTYHCILLTILLRHARAWSYDLFFLQEKQNATHAHAVTRHTTTVNNV